MLYETQYEQNLKIFKINEKNEFIKIQGPFII
jgi:hypothetical protein